HLVGSLLGDEALTEMFALAGAAAALWLLDGDARFAALTALFLAAAAMTKNEGLMLSVALAVMLVALRPRRAVAASAAAPFVGVAAWKVWLSTSDITVVDADYRFRDALNPSYLGDHAGRLWTAFHSLPGYLFDPGALLLALPLTLALALLVADRLAIFAAG